MSNKPSIPAWQRAQQPLQPSANAPTEQPTQDAETTDNLAPGAEESTTQDGPQEATSDEANTQDAPLSAEERSQQLEIVKSFLQDPGVKDEPVERKREFLESKGIAQDMIDQELGSASTPSATTPPTITAADFASFKETSQTPTPQPQQPTRTSAPPIITYPEFLEDARKPPPLITPMRVLNATYIASGIAALAYGASTFLVKPMAASLTDARHDFATHNQSKLDEFNTRLSTLVSKIPDPKPAAAEDSSDSDDVDSVASDPTELFHRDIGTQTSPATTPPASTTATTQPQKIRPTADKQNDRLAVLKSHLDEILAGLEAGEQPAKDRLEETNKLRHHLDNMMYRVQTANVWSTGFGTDQKPNAEADDAIEEVKREIRGVKGVLLSAKRFAPVGGVGGRGGS